MFDWLVVEVARYDWFILLRFLDMIGLDLISPFNAGRIPSLSYSVIVPRVPSSPVLFPIYPLPQVGRICPTASEQKAGSDLGARVRCLEQGGCGYACCL